MFDDDWILQEIEWQLNFLLALKIEPAILVMGPASRRLLSKSLTNELNGLRVLSDWPLYQGLLIAVDHSRPWVVSVEPERPTPRREFFAEPRFTPEQWAQRVAAFEQGLMTAETLVRSSGVLLPSDPPAN